MIEATIIISETMTEHMSTYSMYFLLFLCATVYLSSLRQLGTVSRCLFQNSSDIISE